MNKKEKNLRKTIQVLEGERDSKFWWLFILYGGVLLTLYTIIIPIILAFFIYGLHRRRSDLYYMILEKELELLEDD